MSKPSVHEMFKSWVTANCCAGSGGSGSGSGGSGGRHVCTSGELYELSDDLVAEVAEYYEVHRG